MANTADLIGLRADYPEAFADPEASPQPPETTGTVLGDAIAANLEIMHPDLDEIAQVYNECRLSLIAIDDDADLLQIAVGVLKGLAAASDLRKGRQRLPSRGSGRLRPLSEVVDEVSAPVLIDLPETHARQGTAECASGMCDL